MVGARPQADAPGNLWPLAALSRLELLLQCLEMETRTLTRAQTMKLHAERHRTHKPVYILSGASGATVC